MRLLTPHAGLRNKCFERHWPQSRRMFGDHGGVHDLGVRGVRGLLAGRRDRVVLERHHPGERQDRFSLSLARLLSLFHYVVCVNITGNGKTGSLSRSRALSPPLSPSLSIYIYINIYVYKYVYMVCVNIIGNDKTGALRDARRSSSCLALTFENILKLPCWVCGTHPSTLEWAGARAHQKGAGDPRTVVDA